tara:strand:- start:21 stop:131 length:111 start_codon:yes stop_codon:yes gene_type:complete
MLAVEVVEAKLAQGELEDLAVVELVFQQVQEDQQEQ